MSVRILHLSDLHLDSSFDGLSAVKSAERRNEQFEVLSEIIAVAESSGVSAIVISGDLFDRPTVANGVATSTADILGSTQIPTFISPGNHDFYSPLSPYSLAEWPENVHIFCHSGIERVELDDLVIYGAAFTGSTMSQPILRDFSAKNLTIAGGLLPSKPSVMVIHGELNPHVSVYNPILSTDIASSGLDYLALGHIHTRTAPQKLGNTVYSYPGCPAGRGYDELGDKGYNIVTIDTHKKDVRVEFHHTTSRKYHSITVDVSGSNNIATTILQSLPIDSKRDLYKITLEGQVHPNKMKIESIAQDIAHAVYHAKLVDRTKLPTDIWEHADKDTLTGTFLNLLRQNISDPVTDSDLLKTIELAASYGIAALTGEEAPHP